jgi:hypothetical protein
MNVGVPEQKNIVSDETMLKIYDEVLDNIREDRKEVSTVIDTFLNLVVNEGDATSSSKEALVQLLKIKTDLADKKSKIATLMTQVKLRDPFPKYLAAQQNNTIKIGGNFDRKKKMEILKLVEADNKNAD